MKPIREELLKESYATLSPEEASAKNIKFIDALKRCNRVEPSEALEMMLFDSVLFKAHMISRK